MKGLFLNSIYSSIGNIKLFLLIVLGIAVTVMITGNPTAQELFVYITITAFSMNAVVSSRKDAASKWNKFELTMPILRKQVIQSKYLSYLFWVITGTALALIVTLTASLIHSNANVPYGIRNLCSMFSLGIGIALLTGSLFYPISYIVGLEKSETVLNISVLAAIGLAITALHVLNLLIAFFAVRVAAFIIFYLVIFSISYGLTLLIYFKKEF